MEKLKKFISEETVLVISFVAALLSSFFVRPSEEYFSYIDFKVLALLFCLMAIVSGLKQVGLFNVLAQRMTEGTKKSKLLRLSLIIVCFFSSMLITNDVALITFVPFAIMVLNLTAQENYIIYVVSMQTVAANLGSMLTPVGNPQNLFIYSFYGVNISEFFIITTPVTITGLILIIIFSLLGENENVNVKFKQKEIIDDKRKLKSYILLFGLCLLSVFHLIDYRITFSIVLAVLIITDKKLLKSIDYSLLATFVCFFILVGNMAKIESVSIMVETFLQGRELLFSVLLSQVFSNVPAAVFLSSFTQDYKSLLLGTNIGGLGTLIASLASLISYKFYIKTENAKPFKYLAVFTAINLIMAVILYLFSSMCLY